MKAMLLAAGRGNRLRPLTDQTPKPLLPVGPRCLIEYNLMVLKQAGVEDVIINVCHHAKQIMQKLGDGKKYGLRIQYSYEKEKALGTGGGVFQALKLLGSEPFLLISSDVWSQYSFGPSMFDASTDVHLVLVENPIFHPKGDYALSNNGKITMQGQKLTFSGIAKVNPQIFRDCQPGSFSISPLFNKAVLRGLASGEVYNGPWFNVGTIEELTRLKKTLKTMGIS